MIFILSTLYIILPIIIIYITEKNDILNKIGAIIIAYIIGLILGHIGFFPHPGDILSARLKQNEGIKIGAIKQMVASGQLSGFGLQAFRVYKLQGLFISIAIPIALPLLLFSLKIKVWFRMSLKTLISMLLAIFAVTIFIVAGFYMYRSQIHDANKIAGMLVGLYTGGTPNLAALKQILGVDVESYIMTHTYDTLVGVFYLLFLITAGKNFFRSFMLPYPKPGDEKLYKEISFSENAYEGFFRKVIFNKLLIALAFSAIIFGISAALGMLAPKSAFMLTVILAITTFSIIASLIPKINAIEKTYELGMYFIVVFSLVVATMADISKLVHISASLLIYITFVYFGSLVTHALLCKIFKVDADTMMVTSTALLCSPPFVPLVAGALKNKEVVVSGLTVGIMGYAIGNYLGALLANIL